MIIKTSELIGPALDWAVACIDNKVNVGDYGFPRVVSGTLRLVYMDPMKFPGQYTPSTDWAQGGPLIERERITLNYDTFGRQDQWIAKTYEDNSSHQFGPTHLVAAMRSYVMSRLGDEVDVPEYIIKKA
jgi:hypothetical protein